MRVSREHSPVAWAGWQSVLLIAATYVYFLIFAQFGFLSRLAELGIAGAHLKAVMGAMALGGIAASLAAARIGSPAHAVGRLRVAFAGCAAAALLTCLQLSTLTGILVAGSIGVSLGLLTVTLVANLQLWTGPQNGLHSALLKVGLGTGLGYAICNIPALFAATPVRISVVAAVVCVLGAGLTLGRGSEPITNRIPGAIPDAATAEHAVTVTEPAPQFWLVVAWFTALIWLDSAAFFIIQNSPELQAGTWHGAAHLWRNSVLHLGAALASALLIVRIGLARTLLVAFACLGGACLLLLHPAHSWGAAYLYPVGVSLYSVALVAYPSFLLRSPYVVARTVKAGWIYAIAGWVGSALGIGMGQNLHHVPPVFVGAAGLLLVLPMLLRTGMRLKKEAGAVAGVLLLALLCRQALQPTNTAAGSSVSLVQQGRQVYIAEGCIHCHSQYVRPHSADVLLWGPAGDLEAIRREQPPLIGNRRQGPDLSEVGSRRSALWLRMHFMQPRDVSYDSVMPSYAALFARSRGDALLAYMQSLHSADSAQHLAQVAQSWHPAAVAAAEQHGTGNGFGNGAALFRDYCATCHMPGGRARERWAASFKRLPPDLFTGPYRYLAADASETHRVQQLEPIIKFGIYGTDMPGHEYLPDRQVVAIAMWLAAAQSAEQGRLKGR